jgi:cellulose synthase operon protein C
LPTALEWMEAWLSGGRGSGVERPAQLIGYQARMIEAACSTATTFPLTFGAAAIGQLVRRLVEAGEEYRRPLLLVAGSVFRCLRRHRLAIEADALIQLLDLDRLAALNSAELPPEARVGLAIGCFITSSDDFGNRLLNEAREAIFLAEGTELRQRTQLAIAYAEALGFAPPRIAHGRLEELFQRPRFLVEAKGSTNRFFTLKPLQLIDAIVRSVVTDDFTLGPAVRDWLDDDEFLIRGRIHRDMAQLLSEQGMG